MLLGIGTMGYGQEKQKSYSNQQWIQYYNTLKLSGRFLIKTDGGYRVKNNFAEPSQFISRTGLYHKIMPRMQLGAGFAFLGFYGSDSKINRLEYRPYQELLINDKYDKFKTQHRIRIEQRFFSAVNGENYFYHRFRYRFLFKIPLLRKDNLRLDLNLADEIFIHGGKDVVYNVFNQNRLMIGTTLNINKNLAFTLTYNSQYAGKNSPGVYEYSNIVWLGIKQSINPGNYLKNKESDKL